MSVPVCIQTTQWQKQIVCLDIKPHVCVCVALYVWNIRQRIVYLDEAHYKAGDEVAVMVLL